MPPRAYGSSTVVRINDNLFPSSSLDICSRHLPTSSLEIVDA